MTVITGPSGSGKSSLAFDTVFAEGQRKYVESLSVHARQFLDQMPKPDVDRIDGLTPTIAIEQRVTTSSPRSTVATITEIYDFLRLLFARAGTPTCWECGREISRQSTAEITDAILALPQGRRFMVLAPLVHKERGDHLPLLTQIARQGFVRARINGKVHHLEDVLELEKNKAHTIDVIIDRLSVKEGITQRVADSVELALSVSDGRIIVAVESENREFEDRLYSSRFACPDHPQVSLPELSPRIFSFNSPHGACEECHGLGTYLEFDPDLVVTDTSLPLSGTFKAMSAVSRGASSVAGLVKKFCESFGVAPDIPYKNLPRKLMAILLHGTSKSDIAEYGDEFPGVIPHLRSRWKKTDSESLKEKLHGFMSELPCRACNGERLNKRAIAVKVAGVSIGQICQKSIADAREFFEQLTFDEHLLEITDPIVSEVRSRLRFMCDVGVDYLTLDRAGSTLSGGEAQRIRLATQIGSRLVGVCYVLDEPTIGLHQRDSRQLVATLKRLVHQGNTVVVVEHDETAISSADHVIDMGPGAGLHGGEVVAQGSLDEILNCPESVSAQYFTGVRSIDSPDGRREFDSRKVVQIHQATANNLKSVDACFPLGCFVCVTGVSGSGKSTLVSDILRRALWRLINGTGDKPGPCKRISGGHLVDRVIEIDQTPIGRSPRSNPGTYVGVFDLVRQLYAKTREAKLRGYSAARFSFNVKGGRCEECQGQGTRRIEMHFLPDVFVECSACKGSRYNRETLEIRYRGKTIADILDMRVEEAYVFFENFPKIRQLLKALIDVGLGYVLLGQSSTTLSGGEAQRVKLAAELGKTPVGHTMYIMDEPTTGLHMVDVHNLVNVMNRLVSLGHTVVVIEHNLDVIKMADWVIDLGPEGGDAGGEIVIAGTPEEVADCPRSYTGRYLKPRLAGMPVIGKPS